MKKKSEFDTYQGSLRFDNLNFKLAVLQHLIFEKKVFSPKYDFGDIENMYYEEDYSSEQYEEVLERYKQEALQYFTYLKVPADLAKEVTQLHIEADDDIYFEINPEWDGEGSFFDVDKISDREISQYPKLKKISFFYMSTNVDELKKQLKKHHIRVEMAEKGSRNSNRKGSRNSSQNSSQSGSQKSGQKSISPVAALLCILAVAVGTGGLTGRILGNQYRDVEVIWSEESDIIDEKEENPQQSEDFENQVPVDGTNSMDGEDSTEAAKQDSQLDSNFDQNYEESQKELLDKFEEIKKELDKTAEDSGNE